MRTSPAPPLMLLLVLAGPVAAAADTASRVTFAQEATCPTGDVQPAITAGAIRQLTGATDERACLVECSTWQQCVAVHQDTVTNVCRLASLSAWLQHWQPPATAATGSTCASFIRPPPLPASLQPKLLAFYNFRFGLTNQANASSFQVTASNANRTRLGLELLGNFGSQAEVNLMGHGLSHYLGASRQVTFYIKVTTTFNYENSCFHRQYNKTRGSADGVSGKWCRVDFTGVTLVARDISAHAYKSGPILSSAMTPITFGTAVAYDPVSGAKFYYNGAADTATPVVTSEAVGEKGNDGLAIGSDSVFMFKGFVHCYGVAAAALTAAEVQLLDGLC